MVTPSRCQRLYRMNLEFTARFICVRSTRHFGPMTENRVLQLGPRWVPLLCNIDPAQTPPTHHRLIVGWLKAQGLNPGAAGLCGAMSPRGIMRCLKTLAISALRRRGLSCPPRAMRRPPRIFFKTRGRLFAVLPLSSI